MFACWLKVADTTTLSNGSEVENASIYSAQDLPDTLPEANEDRASRGLKPQSQKGLGRIFGAQYRLDDASVIAQRGDGLITRKGDGRTTSLRPDKSGADPLVAVRQKADQALTASLKGGVVQAGEEFFVEQENGQGL
ncbi:hypothetical protein CEW83_02740 [Parazoarcus communis]|uniref:Uncharacterized protein n=1 Tax=Parazoarcus communis TaxID=41977 RepID=A0A2U8GLF9_9RHOO|nr:hypothetical protein [Parazoarcus communis]AWI74270.1 hypothetical protein CEW83_02740 [Parazoarcus communis]